MPRLDCRARLVEYGRVEDLDIMVDPADMLLNRGLVPFQPRPDLLGGRVDVGECEAKLSIPNLTRRRIGRPGGRPHLEQPFVPLKRDEIGNRRAGHVERA